MSYWENKVVLITGGSSGLGLSLARQALQQGATVILVARQQQKLDEVTSNLRSTFASDTPNRVLGIPADVTKQADVDTLFAKAIQQAGKLDAVICAAGKSTRGAVTATTPEQMQELWDLNFLAVVRCTLAALPHLQKQNGSLVFIGSLASKLASKHLGAYPASKFPLSAYAQQLRLELEKQGPHVLLVCPGPIRRDDANTRYDASAEGLPEEARKPGAGVRLRGIDPDKLSRQILRACETKQAELIVPLKARLAMTAGAFWPTLGDWLIKVFTRA